MMISIQEGICPMCQSEDSKRISTNVMECSGQDYRKCNKCKTYFVDTYLLDHEDENEVNQYDSGIAYSLDDFSLEFDSDNPNSPICYYPEIEGSNSYLMEAEGESPYLQDYLLGADIEAAEEGVLNIIDLKELKIYFNEGKWLKIDKREI